MDQTSPLPLRRGGNQTFGRRLGRPLSTARKAALAHLETLAIPAELLAGVVPGTLDPRTLFPGVHADAKIWFEIGFGSGEHLHARMKAAPRDAFIGAEPYINGMSALLVGLESIPPPSQGEGQGGGQKNLSPHPPSASALGPSLPHKGGGVNLRLYMNDAMHIVHALAPASMDGLYVLNPDPWPKKKHHKRRIISDDNLAAFARVLRPGGTLTLSTDVQDYAEWMMDHVARASALFTPSDATAHDPHTPPADWPLVTRYMDKGVKAGRAPYYLVYTRR